jgi:phosphoribosylamine---glycine ligase
MMRLQSDVLDLLEATAKGQLAGRKALWRGETALTVVMATKGYPGAYGKGSPIAHADDHNSPDVQVFHAGTGRQGQRLIASGGRVLGVTALGASVSEAQKRAYAAVDGIDWPDGFCRRDIGWRAVARGE